MMNWIMKSTVVMFTKQDYISVDNPEYENLDPMDIPIGGPAMVKSPEGKLFLVYADGSVIPYD